MGATVRRVWRAWVELTAYIGDFQARLLLTVFYFTVAPPFGLIARLLDPLQVRSGGRTGGWVRRREPEGSLVAARRQF